MSPLVRYLNWIKANDTEYELQFQCEFKTEIK